MGVISVVISFLKRVQSSSGLGGVQAANSIVFVGRKAGKILFTGVWAFSWNLECNGTARGCSGSQSISSTIDVSLTGGGGVDRVTIEASERMTGLPHSLAIDRRETSLGSMRSSPGPTIDPGRIQRKQLIA